MINYDDFKIEQLNIMIQQETQKFLDLQDNGNIGYVQLGRVADIMEVIGKRYINASEGMRKGEEINFY